MHALFRESDDTAKLRGPKFVEQVNRVERQALLLLNALHWIYVALGAFAAASLVTLLGALFGHAHETLIRVVIGAGLLLGFAGVSAG